VEPDLDDTLPGRTPALDAFARRMGLDVEDVEDTVVALAATEPVVAEDQRPRLVEPELELGETAPVDPRTGVVASFGYRIGATGPPAPIDTVIYVGRRPSTPRITGGTLPTLVTVPSPQQLVSSTHLQIHQEGATVVVSDLRSTNGTIVTVPGRDPRTLLQGESLVVTPGTIIDIGDDTIIEIVALGRLRAPETRA